MGVLSDWFRNLKIKYIAAVHCRPSSDKCVFCNSSLITSEVDGMSHLLWVGCPEYYEDENFQKKANKHTAFFYNI